MEVLPSALQPLAAYRQFVIWKRVPSVRPGKVDKLPCDWRTGAVTNAHNPATWGTFEECAGAVRAGLGDGIGFVFTDNDPFWFLDIDGALLPDGTWSPLAQQLCAMFPDAAVEVSQSGAGLHIIGTGTLPEHGCKNIPLGLELYHTGRFVALTGLHARGEAATDYTGMMATFVPHFFDPTVKAENGPDEWTDEPVEEWDGPEDDDDLIRLALASGDRNAAKAFGGEGAVTFRDLWERNVDALAVRFPSETGGEFDASSADASLAARLAFWTGKNPERIRSLMYRSALVREKWDLRGEYYLPRTILNACGLSEDVFKGSTGPIAEPTACTLGMESTPLMSPDMSVLDAGRRHPVAMPAGLFGPAWPLLTEIANGTASPIDYAAISYLAAVASLIGGKRSVRPYETSNWKEPCILWCAAVGDPSARKSPALDAVTAPLRVIEQDNADSYRQELQTWEAACAVSKAAKDHWSDDLKKAVKTADVPPEMPAEAIEPDEPSRRRTLVMDATPEAVGAILSGNPQGFMHFRDELSGWFMSFDRYSPGGREFWLEAYGGRSFTIDRKGARKPLSIPFNGVTVIGGIQPDKLAGVFNAPDDGLTARFLWAWPDRVAFQRPQRLANMGALETAYRRLDSLAWAQDADGKAVARTLPLTPEAADTFAQWQSENEVVNSDSGTLYKSFVGKMDGTVLRLALVGELARWSFGNEAEPEEITLDSLRGAIGFVDEYAKPMSLRVFGDAALPIAERNAAILARYIQKERLTAINRRELMRTPHKTHLPTLRRADAMKEAFEVLLNAGWIAPAANVASGRPRSDYRVNPAVVAGETTMPGQKGQKGQNIA